VKLIVHPGKPLSGTAAVPGDKSLSHRAVLFAALAEGESRIENFLVSGVTRVMLESLKALGVSWSLDGDVLTVHGVGLHGFQTPQAPLNCGNSATTIRLLAGAFAAEGCAVVLDGSDGLRRRPMNRIVEPLTRMGVPITATESGTAPLTMKQRDPDEYLRPLDEDLPVASAQVKSCLLLAALAAHGPSILREPGPSRDHTERMLGSMGVKIDREVLPDGQTYQTRLEPPQSPLKPIRLRLPGDFSSAAFLMVAATITPGSEVCIPGVGLNPTRTGLLDILNEMGADIQVLNEGIQAGEPVGDLLIRSASLKAGTVSGPLVVRMIDEFSVFGAAAAYADGITTVRDAKELRYKESDRISSLCEEMHRLNVPAVEAEDGFSITGGGRLGGSEPLQAHGDHRLAMTSVVCGLNANAPVQIEGAEMIQESFPEFIPSLQRLGADIQLVEAEP
jgi:3-phosphoshikimate 1-carboxyvinyltransferase